MSHYKTVLPTETVDDNNTVKITHPAYAQISASRVSGRTTLYGSEFSHNHFVTVSIKLSEHARSLSNDWHFGRKGLIAVAMSEAQWASFVSGMNVGDGPCCTLQHFNGEIVPQLPEPMLSHKRFKKEIKQVYEEVQFAIDELASELDKPIGKRKTADIKKRLELIKARITGSAGFVADQFDEHMEATTEKAKIEVNAFVEAAVNRAGLAAIAQGNAVLSLPNDAGN